MAKVRILVQCTYISQLKSPKIIQFLSENLPTSVIRSLQHGKYKIHSHAQRRASKSVWSVPLMELLAERRTKAPSFITCLAELGTISFLSATSHPWSNYEKDGVTEVVVIKYLNSKARCGRRGEGAVKYMSNLKNGILCSPPEGHCRQFASRSWYVPSRLRPPNYQLFSGHCLFNCLYLCLLLGITPCCRRPSASTSF